MPQALQAFVKQDDIIEMHFAKPRFVNGWSAFSGTIGVADIGTWEFVTETDNSSSVDETAEGHYFQQNTSSVDGNEAFSNTMDNVTNIGMKFCTVVIQSFKYPDFQRCFTGYTDVPIIDTIEDDEPAGDLFGFQQRYADTNWWVITSDGDGNFARTDTGVAVDAGDDDPQLVRKYILYSDGDGDLKWAIKSYADVALGGGTLEVEAFPTATQNMQFMSGIETKASRATYIRHYRTREYTE